MESEWRELVLNVPACAINCGIFILLLSLLADLRRRRAKCQLVMQVLQEAHRPMVICHHRRPLLRATTGAEAEVLLFASWRASLIPIRWVAHWSDRAVKNLQLRNFRSRRSICWHRRICSAAQCHQVHAESAILRRNRAPSTVNQTHTSHQFKSQFQTNPMRLIRQRRRQRQSQTTARTSTKTWATMEAK